MNRWLSRRVTIDGRAPQMAVVSTDGDCRVIEVHTYNGEEWGTVLTDSEIIIDTATGTAKFVQYDRRCGDEQPTNY